MRPAVTGVCLTFIGGLRAAWFWPGAARGVEDRGLAVNLTPSDCALGARRCA
ncbi:MAG: hypothetical protein ACT4R6_02550 [Gemmatimonadaceae bacterium]